MVLAVLPLLLILHAPADVVRLNNGQSLEGLVVTQTADRVTLDLGTGQVQLRRTQIAAIEQTDRAAVETSWADHNFLHPRFVPAACTNLAAHLRQLQDLHRSAIAAAGSRARLRQEAAALQADTTRGQDELAMRQERLRTVDTNAVVQSRAAWEAYARDVAAANAAAAGIGHATQRLREIEAEAATLRQAEVAYLRALDAREDQLAEWPAEPEDPAVARFLLRARDLVGGFRSAIVTHPAAPDWTSGQAVLEVRLNDRAQARLLLDTGASLVVLGEAFARRSGIAPDTNHVATARLADGRVARGWPIRLDAVEVQGARVEGVDAVVLPDAPGEGLDGLLGMSFLREFNLRVDAASGRVEFSRLP